MNEDFPGLFDELYENPEDKYSPLEQEVRANMRAAGFNPNDKMDIIEYWMKVGGIKNND